MGPSFWNDAGVRIRKARVTILPEGRGEVNAGILGTHECAPVG